MAHVSTRCTDHVAQRLACHVLLDLFFVKHSLNEVAQISIVKRLREDLAPVRSYGGRGGYDRYDRGYGGGGGGGGR